MFKVGDMIRVVKDGDGEGSWHRAPIGFVDTVREDVKEESLVLCDNWLYYYDEIELVKGI